MSNGVDQLREEINDALVDEWYRRSRKNIVASPEEHCADMTEVVISVLVAAGVEI